MTPKQTADFKAILDDFRFQIGDSVMINATSRKGSGLWTFNLTPMARVSARVLQEEILDDGQHIYEKLYLLTWSDGGRSYNAQTELVGCVEKWDGGC